MNDRPAYRVSFSDSNVTPPVIYLIQRDGKTAHGNEIYLWYYGTKKRWSLSGVSDFQARNDRCLMYIESQGKQFRILNILIQEADFRTNDENSSNNFSRDI